MREINVLCVCLVFTVISSLSQPVVAESANVAQAGAIEEVIITGVLTQTRLQDAPIAIATVSSEEIAREAPVSAADLLKNVPGVFVNSSLGEIRNVVFSRGVSANSLDAAGGYYYVSLQEDGLPVTNVTYTNYGPDYLYRPDITLGRLEALRGGTANLTGPNAPGGIFNYISRTGRDHPGVEVRGRYGLEGDFGNPFYRADLYAGGSFGANGWSYSVGGFYRRSAGARDPGYDLNRGGQLKGNITYEYDQGSLVVYAKVLDDHNGWFEFLPARNFDDPRLAPGVQSTDSYLPPRAPHRFTVDGGDSFENWNGADLVRSRVASIGVKWNHDIGGGWSLANNLKYADNRTDWSTGAVIFPVPLGDFANYILTNTFGPPFAGTFNFYDRRTGTLLATVQSFSGFDHTVTYNNLPNQQALQDGILTQAALNSHNRARELMEQLSVTKEFETMSFTIGGYFARSDVTAGGGGSGFGLSPIENQPQLFDITLTTPGGGVQQVTSPEGFTGVGTTPVGFPSDAVQTQFSAFFGHNWKFAGDWTLDWGVRYEHMKISGGNSPGTSVLPLAGGLDGDPDTLFDNIIQTFLPKLHFSGSLNFANYTAALARKVGESQLLYVRYSDGKKAPDLAYYQGLNSPELIATADPVPQHIQQFELGYRYADERLSLSASPFYSRLSDIGTVQNATDDVGVFYTLPVLYSRTETLGVELDAAYRFSKRFDVHSVITLQNPKSKDVRVWQVGAPIRSDDAIVATPDGVADNNPKVMANTTLTVRPLEQLSAFLTWQYMGSRAANRYNTFFLPAFSQFNLGVAYEPTAKLTFNLNVNNVFDGKGVMSWARPGAFFTALDRQSFTPADRAADPDATFSIITIQPRAGFVTVSYKLY
jgi:outer membrane receptor protein involved in Fe transport